MNLKESKNWLKTAGPSAISMASGSFLIDRGMGKKPGKQDGDTVCRRQFPVSTGPRCHAEAAPSKDAVVASACGDGVQNGFTLQKTDLWCCSAWLPESR